MPETPEKLPFETEELQRAVSCGNIHYGLNNDNLRNAAEMIFCNAKSVTEEFHRQEIVTGNYIDFDQDKHGFPHLLSDIKLLIHFYYQAARIIEQTTKKRSNRVFVMGCGPGRLAIPWIELSKKLGIREIVLNDLLPHHVEATREKIARCYGKRKQNIDGVKITFAEGDFLKVASNMRKKFDALFAMWVVTSEICAFNSIEDLQRVRQNLYSTIKDLLTKQGVFVEDMPFSEGIGSYYYIARLKTYSILHDMGILEGENDHMLLSDFTDIPQGGGKFPYHIRYIPSNGKHRRELENSGFEENEAVITTGPSGVSNPVQYEKEFGSSDRIRELFEGNPLEKIPPFLTQKEQELLIYPNATDPMAKRKKTIMWRKRHIL